MARPARIWFHNHKRFWCTKLGGTVQYLAKGRANKEAAQAEFERITADVKRLGNGSHWSLTVAALVEMFVVFVAENRKQRTDAIDKSGLAAACRWVQRPQGPCAGCTPRGLVEHVAQEGGLE